ncbi:MAG: hypothetical protein KC416_10400 [Myxococcales bacterium]|nr:hypothetical protein [Myxococcales bacterium]
MGGALIEARRAGTVDALKRIRTNLVGLGLPVGEAEDVVADLDGRYSEPGRHYHGLAHIEECLRLLDASETSVERKSELVVAIGFHDAIYDPRRSDNEARSADLFRTRARSHVDAEAVEWIASLILSTKEHSEDLEGDHAVLSDVDLAVLGLDPAGFQIFRTPWFRARFERSARSNLRR